MTHSLYVKLSKNSRDYGEPDITYQLAGCAEQRVMRKLVIPSRELQVHMSIVTQIKDYEYSFWCEYDGTVEPVFQICNTQTVVNRIPFNDCQNRRRFQ